MVSINTGMPRISRHQDLCATGHLCDDTAPVLSTQSTVFAEGQSMLRFGDPVAPHKIKRVLCVPHPNQKVKSSSQTVFAEGIGVGRYGDRADDGFMIGAAFTVHAG